MKADVEAGQFVAKTINCQDCHEDFIWTEGEQRFYKEKGFDTEPKRCPDCRQVRKESKRNG
jgi:NAD-dependent SIR2 family protein deacetylase